jgi:hypothetical protein
MNIKTMLQVISEWISKIVGNGPSHRAKQVRLKASEAGERIRECRERMEHGC